MKGAKSDSARVLGTLHARDGVGVVRLEDRFDDSRTQLWGALTDPRHLRGWLGEFEEIPGGAAEQVLRGGGEYKARYYASGWEGTCRILSCQPNERALIATTSEGEPDGMIEVTLTTEGGQTILVIEDRGLPLEDLPAYAAGDQIHLEDLRTYLKGDGRCDARGRWQELHPHYLAMAPEPLPCNPR